MIVAERRFRLRDLAGELRVVLGVFLILSAAGYLAALVQVHYQAAGSGELLPGPQRVRERYAGDSRAGRSRIEQLLEAEHGPFNGSGTMRPAFTIQSRDWEQLTRSRAPEEIAKLVAEREGERLAVLAWVRGGGERSAYDKDDFFVGPELAGQPITPEFLGGPDRVKIRSLIQRRCVDCHGDNGRMDRARQFPLDTHERIKSYSEVPASTQMTLPKLAQTTHVHLLGLSLLYAATGALFCFTHVPREVKFALAPLPLIAQGFDIACWWLARWDAAFAWGVVVFGTVAGLGLAIHVVAGLCELAARDRIAGLEGRERRS